MSYENILKLPEETKEQVRDKANCFVAEELHLRDQMGDLELQQRMVRKHHERLMKKLKDLVLLNAGLS